MLACKLCCIFTPPLCPHCFFIGSALALPLDSASSPAAARGVTSLELSGETRVEEGTPGNVGWDTFHVHACDLGEYCTLHHELPSWDHTAGQRGEKNRNLYDRHCDF